jgi:hypothetical protein
LATFFLWDFLLEWLVVLVAEVWSALADDTTAHIIANEKMTLNTAFRFRFRLHIPATLGTQLARKTNANSAGTFIIPDREK